MDKSKNPWQKKSSKITYTTPYYSVREDDVIRPDGKEGKYYVLDIAPSVFIVPVTENNEIYLVGLYRYTTNMFSWEVPAGAADNTNLLEGAKRELQEETGLVAKDWRELGKLQAFNGRSNNFQYVFVAKDVEQSNDNSQLEEGIKEVRKVSYKNVLEMIKKNEITDSESIAAITLAALHLKMT